MSTNLSNFELQAAPSIEQERFHDGDHGNFFAPITGNRTYLDMTPEFRKRLKKDHGSRWNQVLQRYKHLEVVNRGTRDGEFTKKGISRRIHDWEVCHAIVCHADLPKHLKKSVWPLYEVLDMRSFKKYDLGATEGMRKQHLVMFCLSVLVYNEAQTDPGRRYYPGKKLHHEQKWDARNRPVDGLQDCHERLAELATEFGFTDDEIRSCLESVRSKVKRAFPDSDNSTRADQALDRADYWSEYKNPHPPI